MRIIVLFGLGALWGCKSGDMRDAPPSSTPGPKEAVVVFTRPPGMVGSGVFPVIYDGENLVGLVETGNRLQYRCAAGPHLFLGWSAEDSKSAIRAELAAGKTYWIQVDVTSAGFTTVLSLIPVLKTHPDWGKMISILDHSPREVAPSRVEALKADHRKRWNEVRAHFEGRGKDEVLQMGPVDGW